MENLLPADYALCGITAMMALLGLFRGFSGTLAFVLAAAAAACVGTFGWGYSAAFTDVVWMRGAGTLVGTLLTFGIVRMLVRKLVGGLLAQPSDALLGLLIGASVGVLLLVVWAATGFGLEYSVLATKAAAYVR